MNRWFPRVINHVCTPALALLAAALLIPCAAQATPITPYVVTFVQQGNNVVATGRGEFSLAGSLMWLKLTQFPQCGRLMVTWELGIVGDLMPIAVIFPGQPGSGAVRI